jgi:hypothetical protein
MGRRRTLDASKFEKWARAAIRSGGGDPDRIGSLVGLKLHWLVYPKSPTWRSDVEVCIKRGRAMAWRHKVIIAEQVMIGEAEPPPMTIMSLKLGRISGPYAAAQAKMYGEILRRRRELQAKG